MPLRNFAIALSLLTASCTAPRAVEHITTEHAFLHRFVGDWAMEGWSDSQGSEGRVPFKGTFRCNSILNGHFIQMETSGQLGDAPWLASAIVGFDTEKQKFQSVSITANGTSLSARAEGEFNKARDGFVVQRESKHPGTGELRTIRYEHRALPGRLELRVFAGVDELTQIGFYESWRR